MNASRSEGYSDPAHIGAPRLENRQEAHHHIDGALHGDAHPGLRFYTKTDQQGQTIGTSIEFGVAEDCSSNTNAVASALPRPGARSIDGLTEYRDVRNSLPTRLINAVLLLPG